MNYKLLVKEISQTHYKLQKSASKVLQVDDLADEGEVEFQVLFPVYTVESGIWFDINHGKII